MTQLHRLDRKRILGQVYAALQESGYNPAGQLVGYILSEDPTYITTYNGARQLVTKIDRDKILEDIVESYFSGKTP